MAVVMIGPLWTAAPARFFKTLELAHVVDQDPLARLVGVGFTPDNAVRMFEQALYQVLLRDGGWQIQRLRHPRRAQGNPAEHHHLCPLDAVWPQHHRATDRTTELDAKPEAHHSKGKPLGLTFNPLQQNIKHST